MAEPHPLTDLFNSGADGVFAYRLPSLLAIGQSTLLAFAQGRIGSRQDNAPAAVYLRRSFDAGRSWERGRAIIRNASAAMIAQQALPSGEPGGVILLLNVMPFSVPCGLGKKRCGACVTYMCRSSDNGATWSSLTPLRDVSTHGSGVGNGIVLRSGRLLAPRRADCCDCSGVPRSYVLISDDHGIRWRAGAKLPHGWTESSVAELPNGSVVLTARALHGRYARDHPGKRRLFAISHISRTMLGRRGRGRGPSLARTRTVAAYCGTRTASRPLRRPPPPAAEPPAPPLRLAARSSSLILVRHVVE